MRCWDVVWLAAMVVNRWLQAGAILGVLGDPDILYNALIYPLRDLLGWVLWVGSYGGENFYYRGKIYKLKDGGRVERRSKGGLRWPEFSYWLRTSYQRE